MSTIGSASLVLSTNASKLVSGLSQAGNKVKSWAASTNTQVGGAFSGIGGKIGGALAPLATKAAAVLAPIVAVRKAISDIGDIAKQGELADALGLSPEFFTGLAGAANQLGVDVNGVFDSLVHMSGKAAAALSNPALAESFSKIGIDAQQFAGMGIEQQFQTVVSALSNIQSPAERVRMGMHLLGNETGKKLAPLLSKSNEELKKLTGQFAVSSAEMKKIQQADEAMKKATASISAVWRKVVVAIAPVIEMLSNRLTQAIEYLQPLFEKVFRAINTHWGVILDILGEVFDAISEVITSVGKWITELFGLENVTMTVEDVVLGVWRAIGTGAAYVWDTIKAGAGAVAWVAGLIVEGFGFVVEAFKEVVNLAKKLPDSIRPDWLDDMIAGTERFEKSVKKTGQQMKKWGKGTIDNFGKSADEVNKWFDNRKKTDAPKPEDQKKGPAVQQDDKKATYTAVAAALKGSKEAISIEARWRTNNMLNPAKDINKQQLLEQQKANKLLNDVVKAISGIDLGLEAI